MSSVNTDPSELFGGTWQRIKDAFILAKGDGIGAGTSGGKKDVTLKVANLPAHNHGVEPSAGGVTYTDYQFTVNKVMESDSIARRKVASGSDYEVMSALPGASDYRTNDITAAAKTASVGNGEAFEIIPPFITKYVWERTA
jgi:microcystin-dependent protein